MKIQIYSFHDNTKIILAIRHLGEFYKANYVMFAVFIHSAFG